MLWSDMGGRAVGLDALASLLNVLHMAPEPCRYAGECETWCSPSEPHGWSRNKRSCVLSPRVQAFFEPAALIDPQPLEIPVEERQQRN